MADLRTDILKEIANVATGSAATALSRMLDQTVMINIPDVEIVPLSEVAEKLGGAEQPAVGVYFRMKGEIKGRVLLIFSRDTGHQIAAMLTGDKEVKEGPLKDLDKSSVMEMGNIISNSYINGLSQLLDMRILPSVPYYAEDMLGAIIDFLLIELAEVSDQAFLLRTELHAEKMNIKGHFIVFADDNFIQRIFERIGVN